MALDIVGVLQHFGDYAPVCERDERNDVRSFFRGHAHFLEFAEAAEPPQMYEISNSS